MRIAFLLAPIALVAVTPAAAQDREADLGRMLSDPRSAELVTAMLGAVTDAFLDTRVGPLAVFTDGKVRRNDTLRDVARRDDPDFEQRLRDNTRRSVRVAGAAAGGMAEMLPELRRTAERMRRVLEPAIGAIDRAPRADDYRDEPSDH